MIANIIVIGIIGLAVFFAGRYIYKSKKNGQACIGCPHGGNCKNCGH